MKKKIHKILGVVLTTILLASLTTGLTVAPVSAGTLSWTDQSRPAVVTGAGRKADARPLMARSPLNPPKVHRQWRGAGSAGRGRKQETDHKGP